MSLTYEATIERVVAHVRETRGHWLVRRSHLASSVRLRRRFSQYVLACPVASAAGYGGTDVRRAISRHGYDEAACSELANAADFTCDTDGPGALRGRMLEAAGLEVAHD